MSSSAAGPVSARSAAQEDGLVGQVQGMVGMVRAQQQGHAVGHQLAQERQNPHLVLEIEPGGGLVQHQHGASGGNGPRYQDQLLLAAAQGGEAAVLQAFDAYLLHCRKCRGPIRGSRCPEDPYQPGPAHQDHVQGAVSESAAAGLRDIPDAV